MAKVMSAVVWVSGVHSSFLSDLSDAMRKYPDHEQPGKEKVYLAYTSRTQSVSEGGWGRSSERKGRRQTLLAGKLRLFRFSYSFRTT